MWRLSRAHWPVVAAVIFFIGFEAIAVSIAVLNHRLTTELVRHTWRVPTVIRSTASSSAVVTLYGVVGRVSPPVSLDSLPAYVANAFVAAEDVRFRNHFGVDPIGMARAL